jgi:hypothetical protein
VDERLSNIEHKSVAAENEAPVSDDGLNLEKAIQTGMDSNRVPRNAGETSQAQNKDLGDQEAERISDDVDKMSDGDDNDM